MNLNINARTISPTPFSKTDINKLHDFMVKQGLPKDVQIPLDFIELLKQHGMFAVTLLKTDDELKYVQLGGESAEDIINNLNNSVEFISYPTLVIGINGMGQSVMYVYKDGKIGLYIAQDGDFGDDEDELVYLSDSLTSFLENKDNLEKLN